MEFPYLGILSLRHSAPHPASSLGYSLIPAKCLAPLIIYALTFSPYKKASFPLTIPHSIIKAALPDTKGVAIDVPLLMVVPPVFDADTIFTPGATYPALSDCPLL